MHLDQIDTFLDLCLTRSFTRTADRLGLTQSTVSARLKALETALGAPLFRRSRAGADLTTEGLRFEPHARRLRLDWTEAARSTHASGDQALTLRLGLQHDLAPRLGRLVADLRRTLSQAALYIEPDYSTQMCSDLVAGHLDFALLFTPKPHPDLHFASLADLPYRLVSTTPANLARLRPADMVMAHFSPAFEAAHRAALPALSDAPLSVGQSVAVESVLVTLGGAGYLPEETARERIASGTLHAVEGAPVLTQPLFAAMLLRNRTARLHRRLTRLAARHFRPEGGPVR
jgi:LysR family transcriptional regulator, flagellar master operon regulator